MPVLVRFTLTLVFLFSTPTAAQAPQDPDPEATVRQLVADRAGDDTPGALVAVVHDGEIVYQEAFGMANLTHGIPYTLDTRTNIGSTSKQFTAFGIGLLAERGELTLDDDVRAYIPELPDFGETVTLRNLLTHTSGYREFLNTLLIEGRGWTRGTTSVATRSSGLCSASPSFKTCPTPSGTTTTRATRC